MQRVSTWISRNMVELSLLGRPQRGATREQEKENMLSAHKANACPCTLPYVAAHLGLDALDILLDLLSLDSSCGPDLGPAATLLAHAAGSLHALLCRDW